MKLTNRRAIEAQMALVQIINMNLPIKTSLDIAYLSNAIDEQVTAFAKVRDMLIKKYQIKVNAGDSGGVEFTSSTEEVQVAQFVSDFSNKLNELMDTEGKEIETRIILPSNISLCPEHLKPILPFVEMDKTNES